MAVVPCRYNRLKDRFKELWSPGQNHKYFIELAYECSTHCRC